jgi:acetyl esterase
MTTPLEPEVQAHLDAGNAISLEDASIDERRALLTAEIDRMFTLFGLPGPDVACIRDHHVPVAGGSVLIRSYHPSTEGEHQPALPAHVILHGGGWTTGSIDELVCDAVARHRAVGARCVVILVEYRLAPEHRFPVAVHDVVSTVRWVREHAAELGVDPRVITLGGASAGGNLAIAAVIADHDLDLQALVLEVPAADLRPTAIADDLTMADPRFAPIERMLIEIVLPEYFDDIADAESPLASPVVAEDLDHFPETHMFTAELDLLRIGAERFAQRLSDAGRPVTLTCYPGALHGSLILTRTWATARRSHDDILATLNDIHRRAQTRSRPS